MLEIIEMFIDGLHERLESIQTAFDDRILTTVSGIAHQLKGAAGGYGYPTLSERAFEVEQLAKQNAPDQQIEESLTLLIEQCHRAIVGVHGSDSVKVAASSPESVASEAIDSPVEAATEGRQNEMLESIHQEVPEVAQPVSIEPVVSSALGEIAARIESLNDPNVDGQQLSAALMSLAQVLGSTENSDKQSAESLS
jgi:HPt (histidine-containing phosphotransfer) domain-containing protein